MTPPNQTCDISVVLITYNRCGMLAPALENALAQHADGLTFELLVIDNNSTDRTREIVESFASRNSGANVRYIFEKRQGVSHARNAGIAHARAPVIAFTDDDIRVTGDWLSQIKCILEQHPEVDYVGGKVLPDDQFCAPRWLTPRHWSPLAVTDRGDAPIYVNAAYPLCLVGANFAFRRSVFDRVGIFAPSFLRCQDHELQLRLWRAGGQGLYDPSIVVRAQVQAERSTKAYHRRWHAGHGKWCALMGLEEALDPQGRLSASPLAHNTLFGVPAFIYRHVLSEGGRWLNSCARRDETTAFYHENRLRYYGGYIRERARQDARVRQHSVYFEITRFAKNLLSKKSL